MGYRKNIKLLYLFTLFHALLPAYIIERLFWAERGMTVQMVIYCEFIYAFVVLVLEIPSGYLADRFGRKTLLIVNGILSLCEFVILLFADNFAGFALAIFLTGIGRAMASGTQNALLYDSMLAEKEEQNFEKVSGRLFAIEFGGTVVAGFCGSFLAKYFPLEMNYLISVVATGLAAVTTFMLKEPPRVTKEESELNVLKGHMRSVIQTFWKSPMILLYSTTGAVLGACLVYLDEFWQLLIQAVGVPVIFFGLISAGVYSLRIPGNLIAYKLKERFRYGDIFKVVIMLNIVGYFSIFIFQNKFCILAMMVVSFAAGVTEPLTAGYLHHHTESDVRATVESFTSLGMRGLVILVGLGFGYVSTRYTVFIGFVALSIICAVYLVIFLVCNRRLDNKKDSLN